MGLVKKQSLDGGDANAHSENKGISDRLINFLLDDDDDEWIVKLINYV